MAHWVQNQCGLYEETSLIPGLTQQVTDLMLLQAVVYVADVAQVWCCPGCSISLQLQLQFNPKPGNCHILQVQPVKKKLSTLSSYALLFVMNI